MPEKFSKIGLGGGCHWCTEAVFQSLKGVHKVEQGFIASTGENSAFSEAVIIHFNTAIVPLERLIEIHLYTHNSTSNHSLRSKYRSAIYTFSENEQQQAKNILKQLQAHFDDNLITKVYSFGSFKPSEEKFRNYYLSNPQKPFCKTYIHPKIKLLLKQFSADVKAL